ncbi:putative transcription repressor OFP9 [Artemisia annua]|uniref:Transcription repressor n=1 Tax=Artemisia annua TaxID=35608 RepID=A0A2U1M9Y8_ARTAN|nr:putative transcription repressor OFP9 [Artemisia annua]PWA62218.1 putative transcription repressor OFP9 [Artemisia annua]
MPTSRGLPKKQKLPYKGCRTLCCNCRLSVSSSSEETESGKSSRHPTVSSLAHAMVQERLDQIIKDRQEKRYEERRRKVREDSNKLFVMVALEKSSYNLRKDFRDSMMEMITTNRISQPKDLRRLLNCYISMNSEEFHGVILEVFHEVCSNLFLYCKCN